MPRKEAKLEIWTEGLEPSWRVNADNHARIRRGAGRPELVQVAVRRMEVAGAAGKDCLLIVHSGERQLTISLVSDHLLVSDPGKLNYQNVSLPKHELVPFLKQYFPAASGQEGDEINPVRVLEWIVLAAVLVALAGTLNYLSRFMRETSGFLPRPEVLVVENPVLAADLLGKWSGLYVTRLAEGQSLIEITAAGTFGYYDLVRGAPGAFILRAVETGACRPVYEAGRLAILTDNRFLFFAEREYNLLFLERPFTRIARERSELPFVEFP